MGAQISTALEDAGVPDDYNCAMKCAGAGDAAGAEDSAEAKHGA